MTRTQANARTRYGYPEPRLAFVPEGLKSLLVVGATSQDVVRFGPTGDFSFRFTPAQAGLWTILFHTTDGRNSRQARRPRRALGREGVVITILVVSGPADESRVAFAAAPVGRGPDRARDLEDALEKLARNRRIDAVLLLDADTAGARPRSAIFEEDPARPPIYAPRILGAHSDRARDRRSPTRSS